MKKNVKKFILIFGIIFLIFVFGDCIRIKNVNTINTKPIITIFEKEDDNQVTYYGIGYSVQYYKNKNSMGSGAKILIFNLIPIWSYEAQ